MSVRWTYIDPPTVFNPFIGFQTVLIALIGGAATLWGPLIAADRVQPARRDAAAAGAAALHDVARPAADPVVLYLPGGLASLRGATFAAVARRRAAGGARALRLERRQARDERREKERRVLD